MNTIKIIMRSIITSLFVLIGGILICFHITLTAIKIEGNSLNNIINYKLLYGVTSAQTNDDKLAIDNYINHIIHKTGISGKYKNNEIIEKIKIEESKIEKIRTIYNTITNNSIYLIICISLFALLLVYLIYTSSLSKSLKMLSIAIMIGSIMNVIITKIMISNLSTVSVFKLFITSIITNEVKRDYRIILIIYILISIVLYSITLLKKCIHKK